MLHGQKNIKLCSQDYFWEYSDVKSLLCVRVKIVGDLELRHPRCVFKIRCGQGSQTLPCPRLIVGGDLHLSQFEL